MLEKIKKYVAGIAGAVMIGSGVVLGGNALGEYMRTNDFYHINGTAIVVKDDQITDIYSTDGDLWVLEDSLFHIINDQKIELHEYEIDRSNHYETNIKTSGKVIDVPRTHSGFDIGPFSKGRANGLSYERNGLEITYDISWETTITDPDQIFIRFGPLDYHSTLQEMNDHIASNMNNYLKSALDKLSDEEFHFLLRRYNDRDSLTHEEVNSSQKIVNSVEGALGNEIFHYLYETYGTLSYNNALSLEFEYDIINEMNSGIAEGESIAYLTGEDYITELTDVAGWVMPNIAIGIVLSLGGLTVAGVGLRKKPKQKNKELFTDGEIIERTKRQWTPETLTEQSDSALYAQEQLKALEK